MARLRSVAFDYFSLSTRNAPRLGAEVRMTTTLQPATTAADPDTFVRRHIGPSAAEIDEMLATLGYSSLDEFIDATIPETIRARRPLALARRERNTTC